MPRHLATGLALACFWLVFGTPSVIAADESSLIQAVKGILDSNSRPATPAAPAVPTVPAVPEASAAPATPPPPSAPKLFDFVNLPPLARTEVQTLPSTAPLAPPPWQEPPRPPGTLVPDVSGTVTCERPFALTEAMQGNPWEVRIAPELTYDVRTFEVQSVLIAKEAHALINGQLVQVGGTEFEPFAIVMIRSSEVVLQYGPFKLAVPEGRPVTVRTVRK